jgi:hypothetical protein
MGVATKIRSAIMTDVGRFITLVPKSSRLPKSLATLM